MLENNIGVVLSGTLNSWVRMMDNIALLCKYIQTSELLPEKFSKRVPTYIDVPYIRDLRVCDLAIVYTVEPANLGAMSSRVYSG